MGWSEAAVENAGSLRDRPAARVLRPHVYDERRTLCCHSKHYWQPFTCEYTHVMSVHLFQSLFSISWLTCTCIFLTLLCKSYILSLNETSNSSLTHTTHEKKQNKATICCIHFSVDMHIETKMRERRTLWDDQRPLRRQTCSIYHSLLWRSSTERNIYSMIFPWRLCVCSIEGESSWCVCMFICSRETDREKNEQVFLVTNTIVLQTVPWSSQCMVVPSEGKNGLS